MRSIEELLEEAKWGKLTNEEINFVVEKIKASKPGSDQDLYRALYILGRSGAKQYRKLVESFLYYPSDTDISSAAINVLCIYWSFGQEYLNELKAFVKGVDWDPEEFLRLRAIGCSGEFLRYQPDIELLQLLIDLFEQLIVCTEDEDYDDHKKLVLECVYESLSRAIGKEWIEILEPKDGECDYLITHKARTIIAQLKNENS